MFGIVVWALVHAAFPTPDQMDRRARAAARRTIRRASQHHGDTR